MQVFKKVQAFSFLILILGCSEHSGSQASEILKSLTSVYKIEVISFLKSQEGEQIEEITDKKEIQMFLEMFNSKSSSNQSSLNQSDLKQKNIDGQIYIWYNGQNKIVVEYDLECCYKLIYDDKIVTERFTYKLGRYLAELNGSLK